MNFYEEEDFAATRQRRRKPDFWHRLNRVLSVLVILGLLLLVGVIFYPVLQKQRQMRADIATLEQVRTQKSTRLQEARREIDLLRTDPEYVETIARDKLNVMKPGETIFRVELPRTIGTSVQP